MENFNKYLFIENLKEEIISEIQKKSISSTDEIKELIWQAVDNACIYYSECFKIVCELGITEFGDSGNITCLAANSLSEFINEELNINDLEKLL